MHSNENIICCPPLFQLCESIMLLKSLTKAKKQCTETFVILWSIRNQSSKKLKKKTTTTTTYTCRSSSGFVVIRTCINSNPVLYYIKQADILQHIYNIEIMLIR